MEGMKKRRRAERWTNETHCEILTRVTRPSDYCDDDDDTNKYVGDNNNNNTLVYQY